jgi:hypothetical protein
MNRTVLPIPSALRRFASQVKIPQHSQVASLTVTALSTFTFHLLLRPQPQKCRTVTNNIHKEGTNTRKPIFRGSTTRYSASLSASRKFYKLFIINDRLVIGMPLLTTLSYTFLKLTMATCHS